MNTSKKEFEENYKYNSFNCVKSWYRQYSQISDINEKTIYLIGNKVDDVENRVIKYEDALDLAEELKVKYFETSAMTGANINKIFVKLCTTLMEKVDRNGTNIRNNIIIDRQNNQNQNSAKCCK